MACNWESSRTAPYRISAEADRPDRHPITDIPPPATETMQMESALCHQLAALAQ